MKPAIDSSGIAALIGAAEAHKGTPEEVIPRLIPGSSSQLALASAAR